MKKLCTALTLLVFTVIFSQNKKEYLVDENNKVIPINQFKSRISPPEYKYLYFITENDTSVIAKTIQRIQYGTISKEERKVIINYLKEISGIQVLDNQHIIINYFFEENTTNQKKLIDVYTSDTAFKKSLKKNKNIAQFFITEKDLEYNKEGIFIDKENRLSELVFKYPFTANYIIIRPDGKFYLQVGEYRQNEIIDKVKADW